jgi:lipopolysaccharide export system permease protein
VKILHRYIVREHVGPFLFAVTSLTSIMMLQYIARRFGDLVGKGLDWKIIIEFFLLSLPFTVELTLPMAVLVAVLYAFSRLGSENEITALKAGGVSTRSLLHTVLFYAAGLTVAMIIFNDQIEPRTNHELATLQLNIAMTKPTFALREQIVNEVQPERFYLRSSHIDEATSGLHDVTLYDVSDPTRKRTVIADSGYIAMAPNMRDIVLTLFDGYMLSSPQAKKRGELDRVYFDVDQFRVKDVANQFQQTSSDAMMKGDREMTVCEMASEYSHASQEYLQAEANIEEARWVAAGSKGPHPAAYDPHVVGGLGWEYCKLVRWVYARFDKLAKPAPKPATKTSATGVADGEVALQGKMPQGPPGPQMTPQPSDLTVQQMELEQARSARDRFGVEIHKKFSLAVACIVLAFVGAPIAVRFPRGGVGLVIGVSFAIFALYYVGLTVGEALSDKGILQPFWAMWLGNVIFFIAGCFLYARMGHETGNTRGGDWRERLQLFMERLKRRNPSERHTLA